MTIETSALIPVPLVVGVTGGSGSGKTTLARTLVDTLGPERATLLAQDAYYRDRSGLDEAERRRVNYDVPDAFDDDLFVAHLRALRAGGAVDPPRYCFATHSRTGRDATVVPGDVVIVEGLVLLHDATIRALFDFTIFVDAPTSVRLARRITRDTLERGRTEDSVMAQCRTTVLPAHAQYVEPTKAWADLVLVNVGQLSAVAEIAASVIRARLAERRQTGLVPR